MKKYGKRYTAFYRERARTFAEYIITTGATIRETAKHFDSSKSTVHDDVHKFLPKANPCLYKECQEVLDYNKSQATSRGGAAFAIKRKKEVER